MSLSDLKIIIRSILLASPKTLTPLDLLREFIEIKGYDFPYQQLGFSDFLQFLMNRDMSDTVKLQYEGGVQVVIPVVKSKPIDLPFMKPKSKLSRVSPTRKVVRESPCPPSYPNPTSYAQQFSTSSSSVASYPHSSSHSSYQVAGSSFQPPCISSQPKPETSGNSVKQERSTPTFLKEKVVEFLQSRPQGAREDDMYNTLLILSRNFTDYGIKTVKNILDTFSDVLVKKGDLIYLKTAEDNSNEQPPNPIDDCHQQNSISQKLKSAINLSAVFRDFVQPIKDSLPFSDHVSFFASTAYGSWLQQLDELRFIIASTVPLIRDLVSDQNSVFKCCSSSLDRSISTLKHSFWLLHLVQTVEDGKKSYIFQSGIDIFDNAVGILDENIKILLSDQFTFSSKKELSSRVTRLNDSCSQLLRSRSVTEKAINASSLISRPVANKASESKSKSLKISPFAQPELINLTDCHSTVNDSALRTSGNSAKNGMGTEKSSSSVSPISVVVGCPTPTLADRFCTVNGNRKSKKERKRLKQKRAAEAAQLENSTDSTAAKTKPCENK